MSSTTEILEQYKLHDQLDLYKQLDVMTQFYVDTAQDMINIVVEETYNMWLEVAGELFNDPPDPNTFEGIYFSRLIDMLCEYEAKNFTDDIK